jgi:hypothetical protein
MPHAPVHGAETPAIEVIERTVVEIQHDRGILYVYGQDRKPLLKITGLPASVPPLREGGEGSGQLSIDIGPESAVCTWDAARAAAGGASGPAREDDSGDANDAADAARVLRAAGATIPAKNNG